MAASAADLLGLDQVRFVVARAQPFKAGKHAAAPDDRLAMLAAAVDGDPRFVVDDRELARPGPSYTVDTLRELRREYPHDTLFLLVGADTARDLPNWNRAGELPGLAHVVALSRPGTARPADRLIERALDVTPVDVSATEVREAVRSGASIRALVPDSVARYIEAHHLYRAED